MTNSFSASKFTRFLTLVWQKKCYVKTGEKIDPKSLAKVATYYSFCTVSA